METFKIWFCGLRRLLGQSVIRPCISEGHSAETDGHKQAMSGNLVFSAPSGQSFVSLFALCPNLSEKLGGNASPCSLSVPHHVVISQ